MCATTATARSVSRSRACSIRGVGLVVAHVGRELLPATRLAELVPRSARRTARRACSRAPRRRRASSRRRRRRSAGVDQPGVQLGALGNANLKPEYSGEFETGFDATLFNSRTTFEFTYYNKKTKDAIIARPLAPSIAGLTSIFDNLGSIRNQGIEVDAQQPGHRQRRIRLRPPAHRFVEQEPHSHARRGRDAGVHRQPQHAVQRAGLSAVRSVGQDHHVQRQERRRAISRVNEVCQDVGGCRAADTAIYMGPTLADDRVRGQPAHRAAQSQARRSRRSSITSRAT